jgi:proteic killer suppression protein
VFKDQGTADVFHGVNSNAARRICPSSVHRIARRKLALLNAAEELDDLRTPPGNRLEALHGDREGQYSIRINDQYRICFRWTDDDGPVDVAIVDYH